ncbi:hypothetical protein Gbth_006_015 [Gluconobacter thailandicus F149-1 = NBRC 100600]|uniref:Transmembrane protein n=2 Tax=Gluconobacter thailandicus TaxID=257438 RepID=A0AAJ0VI47_GLUTH|nr:hypothetical protein [Gluconobacter thailandicus]KXV34992.1 hypothetical protein AD940_04485 [Gluconobacter thailandicus]KXV53835.1 hypothetical protein AD946_06085 [Gluconobacter thailandicus]QEH95316.1 hypothetical protein FXF46_02875 [Gluconobacter thailandicus]GAC88724.1 hypothetical protein NBRC3255_2385 [Gluconobacter thailandicus NBRC 3255]GAD26753.1 hypothetical protein NBRC3257_1752 [Gluconobacter thailandicus NBRC 3257]
MKGPSVRGREGMPGFKWWHGLILGLLLAYVPGSLLVGGVLLLPLVVLHFVDPDADRQRMMIVLFYLGAVMVHPLRAAWLAHGDWQTCVQQITQPMTLILDWMAVGVAWLVAEVSAIGARLWYADYSRRERRAIEKRINALREEWLETEKGSKA